MLQFLILIGSDSVEQQNSKLKTCSQVAKRSRGNWRAILHRGPFSLMGDSHECSFSGELMIVELPQIIVDAVPSFEVLTPQGASVKHWRSSNYTRTFHLLGHEGKRERDLMTDASIRACQAPGFKGIEVPQQTIWELATCLLSPSVRIPICTNKLPLFSGDTCREITIIENRHLIEKIQFQIPNPSKLKCLGRVSAFVTF